MKWLILVLALMFLLVFQNGVLTNFQLDLGLPNLLLVFLILSVLLNDLRTSLIFSATAGLLLDLASPLPDGTYVTSFLGTSLIIYFLVNKITPNEASFKTLFGAVAIGSIVLLIILIVLASLFRFFDLDANIYISDLWGRKTWEDLLLNLIFLYPIYIYYGWITYLSSRFSKRNI